jgi:hypothetical protein
MSEKEKYIGDNYKYYLKRWNGNSLSISWNWAAFFFTYCWAMFRKMYSIVIIFLLLDLLIILFIPSKILPWIIRIVWGLFASSVYMLDIEKRIVKCNDSRQGVNWPGAIVLYIALSIASLWPYVAAIVKSI